MAPRRVYFAASGLGVGHAERVLRLARSLEKDGVEPLFSCFGQGLNYFASQGERRRVAECPALDVEWTEDGSFSASEFIPSFPYMFSAFLRQVAFERNSIRRFDPGVILSDSRLSVVLAGRSESYPVVTMLNQFKVAFPERFRSNVLGRLYERIAGDSLGTLWSLSDEILMTDLPPPYTIGAASIEGTGLSSRVRYVGFTSPRPALGEEELRRARDLLALDGRPLVFFQVSGPDQTKGRLVDLILRAVGKLSPRYNTVVSMGYPGGSAEPRKLAGGGWAYEWCPIKNELFHMCDLVVGRSGHSTIGQCIDGGKPAILVPIHNHPEQIANAERFANLGLGLCIRQEDLRVESLVESVELCLSEPSYKRGAERVRRISERYNGFRRCAEIVSSFS
jgi:UDP-N-acetylglucosamine--N-acetylmuramyl-(pentapeptide) pyrophosphoryl-undecaprenol N-acetylglucosamine transferase